MIIPDLFKETNNNPTSIFLPSIAIIHSFIICILYILNRTDFNQQIIEISHITSK